MATKSVPKKYANKSVVFDNLSNSMKYNSVGTIGFFLTIASLLLSWIPYVGTIFGLAGLAGLVMSIIGLMRKPNGLALIGVIIFGVEFVLGLVAGFIIAFNGGF